MVVLLLLLVGVWVEVFAYDLVAQISKVDYFQPPELVDWTDFVGGLMAAALHQPHSTAGNDHSCNCCGGLARLLAQTCLMAADSLSRPLCFDYQRGRRHCSVSIGRALHYY